MINERVKTLREELKSNNLDAYIITGTDPHQSEYVAPYWRDRNYISGFSGSAGTVVITKDKAILWTDSRYFIQAEAELANSEYILMKSGEEGVKDPYTWLEENLEMGERVGVSADSITLTAAKELKLRYIKNDVALVLTKDLIKNIWTERPQMPFSALREVALEYAGLTREDKIKKVRETLVEKKANFTFISSLDDIAWLTNLRGQDIEYNPVFLSFVYISEKEAILFVDEKRFTKELLNEVKKDYSILPYDTALTFMTNQKGGVAYYAADRINASFFMLDNSTNITGRDITTDLKAKKNALELNGMRRAHLLDGVAFVNFMAHLDANKTYKETDISRLFEIEREKMEGYLGPSFGPISGFREHGAMPHYSAKEETASPIDKSGLLVLDTGSQFEFGTTDLTRTLLFGEATDEEKRDYTLVLKGHLALASQRFPKGTKGYQLDALARQYLWQAGMSFSHGTGHGIGFNLCVHEGPQSISPRAIEVPLEEGMVISNEPGLYKEGRHGIRIENLIAVTRDALTEFGQFYTFETLSIVPYEKELIDVRYLSDIEINLINEYHKWVYEDLKSLIDDDAQSYLESATSPIKRK